MIIGRENAGSRALRGLAGLAATIALVAVCAPGTVHAETFNGPYIGAAAGYESYSGDLTGATYHGYAGWDVRVGKKWVIGGELRFGDSTAGETERRDSATFTETAKTKVDNQLGAQLRAGRVIGERVLIYAAGGYERFDVKANTTRQPKPPCTNCNPTVQDSSFRENVWTAGAGAELAISKRFRLRGAYTYADGDAYHRHSLTASVAYQF